MSRALRGPEWVRLWRAAGEPILQAELVACRRCGAPPRGPCRRLVGRRAGRPLAGEQAHAVRWDDALRFVAGDLGEQLELTGAAGGAAS